MADLEADILIAGGGPAGAWAARALASRGARVLLLDDSHPREKPCGGGLTERSLALLGDAISGVPAVPVTHVRFQAPPIGGDPYAAAPRNAPSITVPLAPPSGPAPTPSGAALVIVDRTRFDAALLDGAIAAGATLVKERVRDVDITRHAVVVRTGRHRFRGRFLIGADGAASLVRHRLAEPLRRSSLSIALGVYAKDVSSREIVIRFVNEPQGYIWSFPRQDHLAIGICAPADVTSAATLRRHLNAWLAREGLADGRAVAPYSWPIPSPDEAACVTGVPVGDRWLLVGDAAGLVDPLTREGIYYALRSGALAANAVLAGPGSPSNLYRDALRREILPELLLAGRARRSFFWPIVSRLWIDVLRESPRVRQLALDVVVGAVGYHHLRRRAVRQLEPSAALRVLGRQTARHLRLSA